MGNTSISSGGITQKIAAAVIGRKSEELQPVARPRDPVAAGEVQDRSSTTQDVQAIRRDGEGSNLDLNRFSDPHQSKVFQDALDKGYDAKTAERLARRDPIVFDLNSDGDTNATVVQRGIEVDGSTHTYWAEQGDGVLSMGGNPIDTVDSQGGLHQDAYQTLKAEAELAGIDTSKGYLDVDDLKTLEAKGLTMLVSNGDGTNQSVKPTDLGITRIDLGGTAVDKTDIVGNLITTEGSFVRDGKTELAQDMWLLDLDSQAATNRPDLPDVPTGVGDDLGGGGGDVALDPNALSNVDPELLEQIYRKRDAALKGEVDCTPIKTAKAKAVEQQRQQEQAAAQQAQNSGGGGDGGGGGGDPLVFDLNADGDTNATVDQRGIEVDGLHATKWAEKGDGVLSMNGVPIDTVDSRGVKHKDAYETLKAEAAYAGIDVSKGYLDTADFKVLESKGVTMLVSNGDGTNQSIPPSELGITKMSLGGKAVDKTDSVGNRITAEGSFERNGQTQLVNDMWFNQI